MAKETQKVRDDQRGRRRTGEHGDGLGQAFQEEGGALRVKCGSKSTI